MKGCLIKKERNVFRGNTGWSCERHLVAQKLNGGPNCSTCMGQETPFSSPSKECFSPL